MIPLLPFDRLPTEANPPAPRPFMGARIIFGLATSLYLLNIAQYASPHDWLYKDATTDIIPIFLFQGTLGLFMGATARPALLQREHQMYSSLPHTGLGIFLAYSSSLATFAFAHSDGNNITLALAAISFFVTITIIALVTHLERQSARETAPAPAPQ